MLLIAVSVLGSSLPNTEHSIVGREIECSVLDNDDPIASVVGEIGTDDGFYSYEKKYIDENTAVLTIPARLDQSTYT